MKSEQLSLFDAVAAPPPPKAKQRVPKQPASENPVGEAEELRYQIEFHDQKYWTDNNPVISDDEYDQLRRRLEHLERTHPETADPNSPTQRVAGEGSARGSRIRHTRPMLGLENAMEPEDMAVWWTQAIDRLGKERPPVVAELKIDGVAVRLVYRDGLLIEAATRGDGHEGEDVITNARAVRNVPLRLTGAAPEQLEVRGEIYMTKSRLEELNLKAARTGRPRLANTRNAAAGAMMAEGPEQVHERQLLLWTYAVTEVDGAPPTGSYAETMRAAEDWGLPVCPQREDCDSLESLIDCWERMAESRHTHNFDVDGMVVKVNSLDDRTLLGEASTHPKWAVAWKFRSEEATTNLKDIRVSVGRFGRMTPVAELEAVPIRGVTVQHASLHNADYVAKNDIRIGDRVLVRRAGDVIPQVVRPVGEPTERDRDKWTMPEQCPGCDGPITNAPGEATHWCANDSCPARLPEQLIHFVSRDVMNIDGMGEQICRDLAERGAVHNVGDVFGLTSADLAKIPRVGPKTANKIAQAIEAAKGRGLKRALNGLQVYRLGNDISTKLAARCRNIDEVLELTPMDLMAMDGIGETRAEAVFSGLRFPRVVKTIELLRQHGVSLSAERPAEQAPAERAPTEKTGRHVTREWPFTGMEILTTGTVEGMTRVEVQSAIRQMGGEVAKSLTSRVNLVIHGEKPGSNLAKAEQRGVTTMHHTDFLKLWTQCGQLGNQ